MLKGSQSSPGPSKKSILPKNLTLLSPIENNTLNPNSQKPLNKPRSTFGVGATGYCTLGFIHGFPSALKAPDFISNHLNSNLTTNFNSPQPNNRYTMDSASDPELSDKFSQFILHDDLQEFSNNLDLSGSSVTSPNSSNLQNNEHRQFSEFSSNNNLNSHFENFSPIQSHAQQNNPVSHKFNKQYPPDHPNSFQNFQISNSADNASNRGFNSDLPPSEQLNLLKLRKNPTINTSYITRAESSDVLNASLIKSQNTLEFDSSYSTFSTTHNSRPSNNISHNNTYNQKTLKGRQLQGSTINQASYSKKTISTDSNTITSKLKQLTLGSAGSSIDTSLNLNSTSNSSLSLNSNPSIDSPNHDPSSATRPSRLPLKSKQQPPQSKARLTSTQNHRKGSSKASHPISSSGHQTLLGSLTLKQKREVEKEKPLPERTLKLSTSRNKPPSENKDNIIKHHQQKIYQIQSQTTNNNTSSSNTQPFIHLQNRNQLGLNSQKTQLNIARPNQANSKIARPQAQLTPNTSSQKPAASQNRDPSISNPRRTHINQNLMLDSNQNNINSNQSASHVHTHIQINPKMDDLDANSTFTARLKSSPTNSSVNQSYSINFGSTDFHNASNASNTSIASLNRSLNHSNDSSSSKYNSSGTQNFTKQPTLEDSFTISMDPPPNSFTKPRPPNLNTVPVNKEPGNSLNSRLGPNFALKSNPYPPAMSNVNSNKDTNNTPRSASFANKSYSTVSGIPGRATKTPTNRNVSGRVNAPETVNNGMSVEQALRSYVGILTPYEREEIKLFRSIYFVRTANLRVPPRGVGNGGFDDENGDYIIQIGDQFIFRYEVVEILGKGSFGQVFRAIDHKTRQVVAIKVIRNRKRFHNQAQIEVRLLMHLRGCDSDDSHHILKTLDHFVFRSHLCIVTELLSINLYEWLKANYFIGTPQILLRSFTKQILSCLLLLSKNRVIHCDLKPENILLTKKPPLPPSKKNGPVTASRAMLPMSPKVLPQDMSRGMYQIKIIDFGSSCYENNRIYTYIQSRFYRSPEVILGLPYGLQIDMWSLGCIIYELLSGVPLFPGENEKDQILAISEVIGAPPVNMIANSPRRAEFAERAFGHPNLYLLKPYVSSNGVQRTPGSKPLTKLLLRAQDDRFYDFMTRIMTWDPNIRLKPEDAINHPWILDQPVEMLKNFRPSNRMPPVNSAFIHTKSVVNAQTNFSGIPSNAEAASINNTAVNNLNQRYPMFPSAKSTVGPVITPATVTVNSMVGFDVSKAQMTQDAYQQHQNQLRQQQFSLHGQGLPNSNSLRYHGQIQGGPASTVGVVTGHHTVQQVQQIRRNLNIPPPAGNLNVSQNHLNSH
ncbi:hypothetical protein BB560_003195 [Smittium megazygosporum]|uniref:Protein kinase domain-containing protein n=1 Tax=Smittium megazygosporum TaxID=133381 RepID=A0A2T9ZCR3_9FUNG|nr:hypothetical protein BB560_003195 [Smittium megazygosporum]